MPIKGTVKSAKDASIVLIPLNTNYELSLVWNGPLAAKDGDAVCGAICLKARKVWTVPAGGSFVSPLFGEPRVVQGIIKAVNGSTLEVQAGTLVTVELPADKTAFDLKNGPLQPGVMVNLTIMPGARFQAAA